ncbi:hypothetical protein NEOLEDRAFT_1181608 [Neolentinus lepideus HHB14362 ss-1]|uniref:Uncharacterized protein n=1 Tax=Neolentinus lepideus HHB14362 ss-1 TaxID=1314782 RepID=A0A165PWX7_9AGAM|nr:hypothetical protein NEOLEDRAFT_1181608 [Neolentinus lepideus HHB14362 ss-1]
MSFFERYTHENDAHFTALPLPSPLSDDSWCIDSTGTLTLQITKETYKVLGLVGTRLPFKLRGDPEQYVIRMPLQPNLQSPKNRERLKSAFQSWDRRRGEEGIGEWDILFNCSVAEHKLGHAHATLLVTPVVNRRTQVHIPTQSIPRHAPKDEDAAERWEEEMSELFEWVGLACMGSQRLDVQDRVDPYVAVYSPPTQSRVGDTIHFVWMGLLSSTFVQSVINLLSEQNVPFASITLHCPWNSPVSYLPPPPKTPPMRAIMEDAEATWSLIFVNNDRREASNILEGSGTKAAAGVREGKWALAETVGKYDTRWG